jgi:potassium channel subfamily K protein 1
VKIVAANNRGISAITNLTVEPNWSFGQAVFFSGTVLTTIGYGHVSPLSPSGKVFCILYALVGIPMTLVMISACVERLLLVTNQLYEYMKRSRIFLNKMTGMVNMQLLTYTHLAVVFAFVLVAFFLLPAAVFSSVEPNWNYLDAIYYCFISLSTIGLGDYIPGDNYEQPYRVFYKIATTCELFIKLFSNLIFTNFSCFF